MFCREALRDLAGRRATIEAAGTKIAIVSLAQPARSKELVESFGLGDVPRFDDPRLELYRGFELNRANLMQLAGPVSVLSAVRATLKAGFGAPSGDTRQLGGTFLINQGKVVRAYRSKLLGDQPDLEKLTVTAAGTPAATS
ncbi:MAG: hypothetical protein IT462_13190 [Planctomycetes bacterium]|nr:hypothetical protein [Planctomycetota bacterium]